ncbi:hypothetical protein BH23BAC1_BH23BAC1_48540 [soil metagenome]
MLLKNFASFLLTLILNSPIIAHNSFEFVYPGKQRVIVLSMSFYLFLLYC